jgi:hypothetical protein
MRRYVPYALALLLLAGLNVWRWVGGPNTSIERAPSTSNYRVEDFDLKVVADRRTLAPSTRELFFPRAAVVERSARVVVPSGPPPKTAEQLADEEAQVEFAGIVVGGIAFQGGKGQAYITRGSESYVVKVGDKIGERIVVQAIARDSVSLVDSKTQIARQIALQGE